MRFETHKAAAEEYLKIAEALDLQKNKENDDDRNTALRIVAAQNYFYAAVNCVEAVFAKKLSVHSFSHENRMNRMIENNKLFTKEILDLYELVDRDQRNKVTYRGENGEKYKNIKKLAILLRETL